MISFKILIACLLGPGQPLPFMLPFARHQRGRLMPILPCPVDEIAPPSIYMGAGRVEKVRGLGYVIGYFRALAYGQSQEAAVSKVQALALRLVLNAWSTAKLALSSDMSARLHKIYRVVPDQDAAREGDLRVVDESGEDYLYPAERFAAVEVPRRVRASLMIRAGTSGPD